MKKRLSNKFVLKVVTAVSFLSVAVGGLSTLAWFQIDSQQPKAEMVTGSTNMEIDNEKVAGYKIEPQMGADGFIDYTNNDVSKQYGSVVSMENNNLEDGDTDYDLPDEGIGYYLIEMNEAGTFTYHYDGNKMYTKFADYHSDSKLEAVDDVLLTAGKDYQIREYNFEQYPTIHRQIKVSRDSTGVGTYFTVTTKGNITIADGQTGSYRVWLDTHDVDDDAYSVTSKIGLEPYNVSADGGSVRATSNALADASAKKSGVERKARRSAAPGTGSKTVTHINYGSDVNTQDFRLISIESMTFSSGYSHDYFKSFLTAEYGAKQTYTTTAGTTIPSTKGWSNIGSETEKYLVCCGSANGLDFYFPDWVTSASYKIVGNSYYNWMGTCTFTKDVWGYGNTIYSWIKDNYGWYLNSDENADSPTKDWGSATISKTGYNQDTDASLDSAGNSQTVGKYYLLASGDITNGASKTGYTFQSGWYTNTARTSSISSLFVTGNQTIYCNYAPKTYNITYGGMTGASHGSSHPSSGSYDAAFYVSAPTKTGYTFTGWTVTTGLNSTYAKWGTTASPSTKIDNSSTKCVNGTSGNVYFKNINATGAAVVLTANWEPKTTAITFDQRGGISGSASTTATFDDDMPTDGVSMPSRTNYDFGGYWTVTKDGGGNITSYDTKYYNADGTSATEWNIDVSTATLYAMWTVDITLSHSDTISTGASTQGWASVSATIDGLAMQSIEGHVPSYSNSSYYFGGYYTGENGTGTKYYNANGTSAHVCDLTDNTTLYPLWVYKIQLDANKNGDSGNAGDTTPIYHNPDGGYYKDVACTQMMTTSTNPISSMPTRYTGWGNYTLEGYCIANTGASNRTASYMYIDSRGYITDYALSSAGKNLLKTSTYFSNASKTLYCSWAWKDNLQTLSFDEQGATVSGTTSTVYFSCYYGNKYTDTGGSVDENEKTRYYLSSSGYTYYNQITTATSSFVIPQKVVDGVIYNFGGYWTATSVNKQGVVTGWGRQFINSEGKLTEDAHKRPGSSSSYTLYARWVRTYDITLYNNGADNSDVTTAKVYKNHSDNNTDNGFYVDVTCLQKMATDANRIATLPTKEGYTFQGYWTGTMVDGLITYGSYQYIDSNGYITDSGLAYSSNATLVLYAMWTFTIALDAGTGGSGTSEVYKMYKANGLMINVGGYLYDIDSSHAVSVSNSDSNLAFGGYWSGPNGTGTRYIDSNGYTLSNTYTGNALNDTMYALWSYKVTLNAGTGSGNNFLLYKKTGTPGLYVDAHCTKLMATTGENRHPITEADTYAAHTNSSGLILEGYYIGTTRYINESGVITSTGAAYTGNYTTLTAYWAYAITLTAADANNPSRTTTIYKDETTNGLYKSLDRATSNKITANANQITKPTKTGDGNTFGGYWNSTYTTQYINSSGYATTNGTGYSTNADNMEFFALWVYNVTLNKQDGVSPTTSTVYKGHGKNGLYTNIDCSTALSAAPSFLTYTFAGYWTAENGGGTRRINYDMGNVSSYSTEGSTTLYALWLCEIILSTGSLGPGNGTNVSPTTIWKKYNLANYYKEITCTNEITTLTGNITPPTRDYYTFAGFYINIATSSQYITAGGLLAALATSSPLNNPTTTLNAKWNAIAYRITLDKNSATNGSNYYFWATVDGHYYYDDDGEQGDEIDQGEVVVYGTFVAPVRTRIKVSVYGPYYCAFEGYSRGHSENFLGLIDIGWIAYDSAPFIDLDGKLTSYAFTDTAKTNMKAVIDLAALNVTKSDARKIYAVWATDHYPETESPGTSNPIYLDTGLGDPVYLEHAEHTSWGCYYVSRTIEHTDKNNPTDENMYYVFHDTITIDDDCSAIIPTKRGFVFAGYYVDPTDEDTLFINENGRLQSYALKSYSTLSGVTLYAKWIRLTGYWLVGGSISVDDETFDDDDHPFSNVPAEASYSAIYYDVNDLPSGREGYWEDVSFASTSVFNIRYYDSSNETWTARGSAFAASTRADDNTWMSISDNKYVSAVADTFNVVYENSDHTVWIYKIVTVNVKKSVEGSIDADPIEVKAWSTDDPWSNYQYQTPYNSNKNKMPYVANYKFDSNSSWVGSYFINGYVTADTTLVAVYDPKIYEITLVDTNATSHGTTTIWEKYNHGFYKNEACTQEMTTSAYGITISKRTNYIFDGYYTQTSGNGNQYIGPNGKLVSDSLDSTIFNDGTAAENFKLYVNWRSPNGNKYTIKVFDYNNSKLSATPYISGKDANGNVTSLVNATTSYVTISSQTSSGSGFSYWQIQLSEDYTLFQLSNNSDYTTSYLTNHSGKYYVANNEAWALYIVSLNARYYTTNIKTTPVTSLVSGYNEVLGYGYSNESGSYTAVNSGYDTPKYVLDNGDTGSGSLLMYQRDNATYWYNTEACSSDDKYTTGTLTGDKSLYAFFEADLNNDHKTFYVDLTTASKPGGFTMGSVKCYVSQASTGNKELIGKNVGPSLYRFTIPIPTGDGYIDLYDGYHSSWSEGGIPYEDRTGFIYHDTRNGRTGIDNWSNNISVIYLIAATAGNNHAYNVYNRVSRAAVGTAVIQYYNSGWTNYLVNGQPVYLYEGKNENSHNLFAYENGLSLPANVELRIMVTLAGQSATYYGSTQYDGSLPYYLKAGTHDSEGANSSKGIVTTGYSGNAKFNFYIFKSDNGTIKLSITTIPELGNGYYIMDYNGSSWNNANTAYHMVQDDGEVPGDYTTQYMAVIYFNQYDVFKIRSDKWLALNYIESGGSVIGTSITNTGTNDNLIVNTAGTYTIYLKQRASDGGYDVHIASGNQEQGLIPGTITNDFNVGEFYVVGSSILSSGSSRAATSTNGFFGGKKMVTITVRHAEYHYFYAQNNQKIYIRSYIEGVDTLYKAGHGTPDGNTVTLYAGTNPGTTDDVTMDVTTNPDHESTGVITFGSAAAGYYNISVQNGVVYVEPYAFSDFFRLNPIDPSRAADTAAIFAQKTAIVLEIPFVANNTYDTKISLSLANCPSYVSAFLYVNGTSKLADPYGFLHGKASQSSYYNSTNLTAYDGGNLSDLYNSGRGYTIAAGTSSTIYAYVLIDYIPVTPSTYPGTAANSPQIQFYLTANQV